MVSIFFYRLIATIFSSDFSYIITFHKKRQLFFKMNFESYKTNLSIATNAITPGIPRKPEIAVVIRLIGI